MSFAYPGTGPRPTIRFDDTAVGTQMIKKFHVLYVGQIELDNIGLNGTPANGPALF